MDGIYLSKEGVTSGPYTGNQVAAFLRSREFSSTDHYWQDGMEGWQLLETLKIEASPEIAVEAEPKRTLPTAVAIIARLLIIFQVQLVLDVAIFPLFILIPGFPLLHLHGHPEIPPISLIPFIHPFHSWSLRYYLEEGLYVVFVGCCGWAMLRGKNWGRIAYVSFLAFGFIHSFFNHAPILSMGFFLPLLHASIVVFFLFQPAANRFFMGKGPVEKPKLYGYGCLTCFLLAKMCFTVVFAFGVSSLREPLDASWFISHPPLSIFWQLLCPFLLFVFFLYFGLATNRFHAWKRDAAIVMTVAILLISPGLWKVLQLPPLPSLPPNPRVAPS